MPDKKDQPAGTEEPQTLVNEADDIDDSEGEDSKEDTALIRELATIKGTPLIQESSSMDEEALTRKDSEDEDEEELDERYPNVGRDVVVDEERNEEGDDEIEDDEEDEDDEDEDEEENQQSQKRRDSYRARRRRNFDRAQEFFTEGLTARVERITDKLRSQVDGLIQISVIDKKEHYYLDGRGGALQVLEKLSDKKDSADCVINVIEKDLLKIVEGGLNPQVAMLSDKIKVEGKSALAIYFFNLLAPKTRHS